MEKCNFNKFALQLYLNHTWHGRSPVDLLHIFLTPFYKDTFGGLLVNVAIVAAILE